MVVALAIGLVLVFGRISPMWPIRFAALAVIEFIRSTPLLIQLFFAFFVLPRYGIRLDALSTGIIVMGLHYGCYTAEAYRAGIESVPRTQWESGVALHMSRFRLWTRIIFPQAIVPVLPVLGNLLIAMCKESAQLAAITVLEMFGMALAEANRTFLYLEPLTLVCGLYFIICYPASVVTRRLEDKMGTFRFGAK
jgi:polar amino acid transport system permease protein